MATTLSPSPSGRALAPADREAERALRAEVRAAIDRLLQEPRLAAAGAAEEARVRALIAERVAVYQRRAVSTNRPVLVDPAAVETWLFNAFCRYGPITPLMEDPTCEEVLINGPHRIWCIRDGVKELVQDLWFESDDELLALVRRLIGPLGERLDAARPEVGCRLPDGSRLHAIIPPIAPTNQTYVAIRRFVMRAHSLDELVRLGAVTENAARFLDACVRAHVSIVVAGPTGSGKTTWLNALGASIPARERVCTIEEEAAELKLAEMLPDCVPMVGRRPNTEGAGGVSVRALVRTALRLRPQRLIIGETRGAEALELLLAIATGHPGSFSTVHAGSPQEALDRLASLAQTGDAQLSEHAVMRMLARAVQVILQLAEQEGPDGRKRRWLAVIYEVASLETGTGSPVITGNVLWSVDAASDRLTWTGIPPRCLERFAAHGVAYTLPAAYAGRNGR